MFFKIMNSTVYIRYVSTESAVTNFILLRKKLGSYVALNISQGW